MIRKPFKPPAFIRTPPTPVYVESGDIESDGSASKRRRISQGKDTQSAPISSSKNRSTAPQTRNVSRKPLLVVQNAMTLAEVEVTSSGPEAFYSVLWRKLSTKKHKTWDGDGVLSVRGGYATLTDISGKDLGKTAWNKPLLPGSTLSVGGKEIEIDSLMAREDYLSGRHFLGSSQKLIEQPTIAVTQPAAKPIKQNQLDTTGAQNAPLAMPASKATHVPFRNPMLTTTIIPKPGPSAKPIPRHDPDAPGALVMKRPSTVPKGKQVVEVVVDPFLSRHLREHQKEGVKFLYECVMGLRLSEGEGAILADDMGLGKTLQTIALLWTLLKQNPIHDEPPVVKKALVVCPVSVINNWRKEFRKWLGNERIGVFVAEGKDVRLTDFTRGKAYNVMIIGYEKLRLVQEDLKKGSGIDIVIADEGHRLKTAQNKSAAAIRSLNTDRRIILSGTPLQNDLGEYFVMVDFVNPGLLGKYTTFKREFENPIVRARQPEATGKEKEKGESRDEELRSLTSKFILRRTADILAKYLPPKTEYVLFCEPTVAQICVYKSIIGSPIFAAALGSNEMALQLISILKKLCNSPSLLRRKAEGEKKVDVLENIISSLPYSTLQPGVSTKIRVLDSLLDRIRTTTAEKIVVVSNYTATLDIIQRLLTSNSYSFLRLDGTTPASKRQGLVDRFNNTTANACFAFLLSAKSGGVGLNLIGASRLVLFDIDWNPATDAQAMARIHRDGQKRPCRIYRLIVKGALDEKIYQRQITKQGLADAVLDNKAGASAFTTEDLKDLFSLDENYTCQTHTLLGCKCEGTGDLNDDEVQPTLELKKSSSDDLDDESDGSSVPELPRLLKASQVDMEQQEQSIKEKARGRKRSTERGQMKALMQYRHIDVRHLCGLLGTNGDGHGRRELDDKQTELIDDSLLVDVLKDEENRVRFVFSKSAG